MLSTPASSHGFEVTSYYKMLQIGAHFSFPCKSIWKVSAPPHIAFFLWMAAKGIILTVDYLRRWGFFLVIDVSFAKKMRRL
jgi:N6-adenosine-specific RNA methylase IME4